MKRIKVLILQFLPGNSLFQAIFESILGYIFMVFVFAYGNTFKWQMNRLLIPRVTPFMWFPFSLLDSVSSPFFIYRSPSPDWSTLDKISNSIKMFLSLHSSANIFAFGDFSIHYFKWLTYATDVADIYAVNFSFPQSLSNSRFPDTFHREFW